MIDTRPDPIVLKARRLVNETRRYREQVEFNCERRIRKERIWISTICLGVILFTVILSIFI